MPVDQLASADLFSLGDPWALWRDLRATQPVAWTAEADGPGFWSVVRYQEGSRLLRDWQSFTSVPGTTLEGNRWEDDPAAGQMLPLLDPPRHDALRRVIAPFFARRRLAEVEADCVSFLSGLLDRCTEQQRFEAGEAIGTWLPMHMSFALLGVPECDERQLLPVIRGTLSCDDAERAFADAELLLYLSDLVEDRRRRPAPDLLSTIASVDIDGTRLSDDCVLLTFTNLLSAGLTTTRLAINGAIHTLIDHPQQWRRLRAEPQLAAMAVEEVLRWTSPALATMRTATAPGMLGVQQIEAGDRVAVWLPSLNRDEAIFDEADAFVLDRVRNPHLAFGVGPHTCIGMALARIELRALVSALPRRWQSIEPDGKATRLRSLVLHGIDRLPVRVRPA